MSTEAPAKLELYSLDAGESTITVQAIAEGLLSVFGHDPVIGVKSFTGEAQFVPGTFEQASVNIIIDANSLVVVNDVKDKDRREIEQTMRQEVLETAKYPEISFTSTNVTMSRLGEGRYRARVIGALTLHGVTQNNLWVSAEVNVSSDSLRAKGDFSIKQKDYQIKLVSVAGGALKVKNELRGSFDVVARRAT